MTTAPTTAEPSRRRSRPLQILALAFLASGGAAVYVWWPRDPAIPRFALEGLDPDVATAIQEARAAVEREPNSPDAWGHLGIVLFAQNMYAESVGVLAQAEALGSDNLRWPYFRALALLLNKPAEGIVILERIASRSGCPFFIRLRLAEEYLKLQRIDEAEARLQDLLQESPDNPRVLLGHGQILIRRGRPAEAIAPLKTAAQHPTARRTARFALAEAYGRIGIEIAAENERALADKTQADQLWPDPYLAEAIELEAGLQPRIDRSLVMAANGQVQEAGAILARVLMAHPDSDEAHLAMAKVLLRSQGFAAADVEVNRAIELNPNLVDAHFVRAGIRMQFKEYDAAERSCSRAVELKPSFGVAHYLLGDCQLKLGRKPQAMQSFREALRSRPDLPAAHRELGALLLDEGKVDEAIRCLENALRLDSADARAKALLEQARAKRK